MSERVLKLVPIRPMGIELTRDSVRGVWTEFVDGDKLQSVEVRVLMACLRSLYQSLPPTENEPGEW